MGLDEIVLEAMPASLRPNEVELSGMASWETIDVPVMYERMHETAAVDNGLADGL